jgi:multisubunit Na+/H+ antiporter MnhB subunit
MTFYDFIGLIGVVLILISYGLLQLEKIDPKAMSYSMLNFIGAVLILISLIFSFNLASFIIEIAWLLISGFGIWKAWRLRRSA